MSANQGTGASKTGIVFERVQSKEYPTWGMRPKTMMFPLEMNFIFLNGGMGDYITWLNPIRWLASEASWIKGTLVVPTYLKEIADYFLKPYSEWKYMDYKDLQAMPNPDNTPFRGPVNLQTESLNATGAHLITCGWVYFTNKEKAPEGVDRVGSANVGQIIGWDNYPQFRQADLDALPLPAGAHGLDSKTYAVITTGVTTESRKIPANYWNHVIEYVHSLGLTPVFLGKSVVETGNQKNIHTEWGKETRFDLGVDLRDQTSLMQAASIMSRAALVVGHDNGLLHLAGCTSVPIVFGYNLASPGHREPRRPAGKTYNVALTHADLECNFCQSKMNFMIGYNFRKCYYGDNKCIDILFENGARRWKEKIDEALAGEP